MYSIDIKELINRPIIRNDYAEEFMNKMTDEEILIYEQEVNQILVKQGVRKTFPDWSVGLLTKRIDREIMYRLLKEKS